MSKGLDVAKRVIRFGFYATIAAALVFWAESSTVVVGNDDFLSRLMCLVLALLITTIGVKRAMEST